MPGVPGNRQRIGANFVGKLRKRHLCAEPARVFCNAIHGITRVVADEVQAAAQHQKRLDVRAHAVPGKFKVAGAVLPMAGWPD